MHCQRLERGQNGKEAIKTTFSQTLDNSSGGCGGARERQLQLARRYLRKFGSRN